MRSDFGLGLGLGVYKTSGAIVSSGGAGAEALATEDSVDLTTEDAVTITLEG